MDFDDSTGWVLTGPVAVEFLPTGTSFPFREEAIGVCTALVGGLGEIQFGVEVRQRVASADGSPESYRVVGSSLSPDPYLFPGGMSRLSVHGIAFLMTEVPFEYEGTYEFRVVAQTATGEVVLEGAVGEMTVLETDGGDTNG